MSGVPCAARQTRLQRTRVSLYYERLAAVKTRHDARFPRTRIRQSGRACHAMAPEFALDLCERGMEFKGGGKNGNRP
jgi:hypothetical protein